MLEVTSALAFCSLYFVALKIQSGKHSLDLQWKTITSLITPLLSSYTLFVFLFYIQWCLVSIYSCSVGKLWGTLLWSLIVVFNVLNISVPWIIPSTHYLYLIHLFQGQGGRGIIIKAWIIINTCFLKKKQKKTEVLGWGEGILSSKILKALFMLPLVSWLPTAAKFRLICSAKFCLSVFTWTIV